MWLWLDNNDTIMYGCITCQNMAEVTILKCGHTVLVMHKWNSGYCSGRLFTTLLPNLRLCGLSYGQFRRLLKTFFRQVYYSVIWTMCSQSSARLFACQQTLANTTITTLLRDLHWLWVPESVKFKLCMLMHRCLTGAAPWYLTELAVPVASTGRRRLRSVSSADLVVPPTRRSTIGDRAFVVAGPRAWNSLSFDIRSSTPSFDTFKKHLKSYLFQLSFSTL